jgi:hypothetical protein
LSLNTLAYTEGISSVNASYTLSDNGSLELFRSYSSHTLDLSFAPLKLSMQVKGQGASGQVFKFMLYEDQNMDGNPFESGDEIYEFTSTTLLENSSWQLLEMPYADFTKVGGGLGTLDLNRIGAWRIVVINQSGNTVSSSFDVDALIQITTYIKPPTTATVLQGSFIQLWNDTGCTCGQWTKSDWENEFQKMKEACLEKVIIQYGFYDNNAWYQPSSLSYATYSNPTLNRIVAAAEAKGIKLYFGLFFDEGWNSSDKSSAATYSGLLAKHKQVSDELWMLFGSSPSFEGWYIPQEINDLEWQSDANRNLLANWLKDVSDDLKTKSQSKKVLVAPFFGPNRPADDLENWWNQVLTVATNIDEVAPQDGVGTTSKVVDVDVPLYFSAIKNACDAKGIQFAATVESFHQTDGYPINTNSFAALPADIATFKDQLSEAAVHTNTLYQFEWNYMQTNSYALYNDYKNFSANHCTVSSVDAGEKKGQKKVYPSLCSSGETLTLEGFQSLKSLSLIEISTGKSIELFAVDNRLTLPNALASGVYCLTVYSEQEIDSVKLMVLTK